MSCQVASTLQSTFCILFEMAKSPVMAAIYYNLVLFRIGVYGIHHAGFSSNLIEVGGEDTAIMNAIANNLANVPGWYSPLIGKHARFLLSFASPLESSTTGSRRSIEVIWQGSQKHGSQHFTNTCRSCFTRAADRGWKTGFTHATLSLLGYLPAPRGVIIRTLCKHRSSARYFSGKRCCEEKASVAIDSYYQHENARQY
eukprot:COSAG02_NODE_5148_length_4590_cov_5.242485_2_plen_199_part_00